MRNHQIFPHVLTASVVVFGGAVVGIASAMATPNAAAESTSLGIASTSLVVSSPLKSVQPTDSPAAKSPLPLDIASTLAQQSAYESGQSSNLHPYIWPTRGLLTSKFGERWGQMHWGIDIIGPIGTPIVAAAQGVVMKASWDNNGHGNVVEIQHLDGSLTRYAHNHRLLVRKGQQVEQGQQIAEMGSTGFSTGPHCHFEVHLPGQGVTNPMAYLPDSQPAYTATKSNQN
ncbi:MAG: M23 family metallopeptidase [Cyanothece sp. SIO1E1]|nr:M23 family metallopeptidase [Cyanothece sp. SIO1E1]